VVTLWNPVMDNVENKRDYPCTIGFQFLIRGEKLLMITQMRSNDVWLGLAYDAFQFTQLQLTLARMLGVEPGHYVHRAASLHIYERDLEAINENLVQVNSDSPAPEWMPQGMGHSGLEWPGQYRQRAINLLHGLDIKDETPSESWYRGQLDQLRKDAA
jgi:hypothetical protein